LKFQEFSEENRDEKRFEKKIMTKQTQIIPETEILSFFNGELSKIHDKLTEEELPLAETYYLFNNV